MAEPRRRVPESFLDEMAHPRVLRPLKTLKCSLVEAPSSLPQQLTTVDEKPANNTTTAQQTEQVESHTVSSQNANVPKPVGFALTLFVVLCVALLATIVLGFLIAVLGLTWAEEQTISDDMNVYIQKHCKDPDPRHWADNCDKRMTHQRMPMWLRVFTVAAQGHPVAFLCLAAFLVAMLSIAPYWFRQRATRETTRRLSKASSSRSAAPSSCEDAPPTFPSSCIKDSSSPPPQLA